MLEARSQTNLFQIVCADVRCGPQTFVRSALVAYIRGIGQTDFNPSVEPGIGSMSTTLLLDVTGNLIDLDLDRVEVLRGPQGTLAGRNAIGGALAVHAQA
jgi:iron complex outermembrane receptor protein